MHVSTAPLLHTLSHYRWVSGRPRRQLATCRLPGRRAMCGRAQGSSLQLGGPLCHFSSSSAPCHVNAPACLWCCEVGHTLCLCLLYNRGGCAQPGSSGLGHWGNKRCLLPCHCHCMWCQCMCILQALRAQLAHQDRMVQQVRGKMVMMSGVLDMPAA
jgi:hypothetical protein